MKNCSALLLSAFTALLLNSGCTTPKTISGYPAVGKTIIQKGFDPELAQKLGADEYGMKHYVMAFLKSGPNRNQDAAEAQALQKAHMDNIHRLANEGKLVLAGPFMDKGELRGIYVFDVTTIEEAQKLTETDPAVKAGRLVMELHPWYGSAALMQVNATHNNLVPPAETK